MQKLLTLLILALIFTGCGNDPITNAGYFDDDVDRSTTTTTNYSNDESTTSNSNNSTNSNNTTTNNYYHDSVIVVHDTLTRTVTKRVTDTTVIRDTVSLTDTITVHTVSVDTIVKTMRDVVRDTLKITVHDTIKETKMDTIKEIVTVTDTVRLLKRDTVSVTENSFFADLKLAFDTLPTYKPYAYLNDEWKIFLMHPKDKYGDVETYKTLLGASRRDGAPIRSVGMTKISFIGKNQPMSTEVNYNVVIYRDTVSDDAIRLGYNDVYRTQDYGYFYTHPDHDKMYNDCIIITKLETSTPTAANGWNDDTIVLEWSGRKKLCF